MMGRRWNEGEGDWVDFNWKDRRLSINYVRVLKRMESWSRADSVVTFSTQIHISSCLLTFLWIWSFKSHEESLNFEMNFQIEVTIFLRIHVMNFLSLINLLCIEICADCGHFLVPYMLILVTFFHLFYTNLKCSAWKFRNPFLCLFSRRTGN